MPRRCRAPRQSRSIIEQFPRLGKSTFPNWEDADQCMAPLPPWNENARNQIDPRLRFEFWHSGFWQPISWTPMPRIDPRPTLEAPDDDPYLWLEEVEGERLLQWTAHRKGGTLARYGDARLARDRDSLKAIFDRPDNIPIVARRGTRLFNYWKDAANPRGLWRTTSLESYREEKPRWDILLDLDRLAAEDGEDWIWGGSSTLPDSHDRAILRLSRGGGDAVVLREFDLGARRFVADGFQLPEAKTAIAWLDRDTLLLASALGAGMATRSGYARPVSPWRRGQDPLAAPVIFAPEETSMSVSADIDRAPPARELLGFAERPGFFSTIVWSGERSGP